MVCGQFSLNDILVRHASRPVGWNQNTNPSWNEVL
jgi:hypothetical protein